jgi:hypothetical protein
MFNNDCPDCSRMNILLEDKDNLLRICESNLMLLKNKIPDETSLMNIIYAIKSENDNLKIENENLKKNSNSMASNSQFAYDVI